jgi:hypothetical protein
MAEKIYDYVVKRLNVPFTLAQLETLVNINTIYDIPKLNRIISNGSITAYDFYFPRPVVERENVMSPMYYKVNYLLNPTPIQIETLANQEIDSMQFNGVLIVGDYHLIFHSSQVDSYSSIIESYLNVDNSIDIPIINYPTSLNISNGTIVNIKPNTSGAQPITYSITPSLPSSLTFNTTNGIISGTYSNGIIDKTYSIKASNQFGDAYSGIRLYEDLNEKPYFNYNNSSFNFNINTLNFEKPFFIKGKNPITYSIVGTLQTGLSFNTNNGEINGTPTVLGSRVITITATNSLGSYSKTLEINVI